MSYRSIAVAALFAAAAAAAPPLAAQLRTPAAAAGAAFEAYRFATPDAVGVESITVFTAPLSLNLPVGGGVRLDVRGGFARGAVIRADGSEATLSGPLDTELRVGVPLLGEHLSVSAIALLPTGSATHSADEALVAGVVAADLLPFRIAQWGTGGYFGAATSLRRTLGTTVLAASATYLRAREFEPLAADRFGYRPGDQVGVALGLEQAVGGAGRAVLDLGLQHFADDVVDGANLYRPGRRMHAIGSYAFAAGAAGAGLVYAGAIHRATGTAFLATARNAPPQDVLLAGGGMRVPLAATTLVPNVDARVLRSADGVGQGYVVGLGTSLEMPAGALTLVPTARFRLGNVVARADRESALTGWELGATLRFGGAAARRRP